MNQKTDARFGDGQIFFIPLGTGFGVLIAAVLLCFGEAGAPGKTVGTGVVIICASAMTGSLAGAFLYCIVALPVLLFGRDVFDSFPQWVEQRKAEGLVPCIKRNWGVGLAIVSIAFLFFVLGFEHQRSQMLQEYMLLPRDPSKPIVGVTFGIKRIRE